MSKLVDHPELEVVDSSVNGFSYASSPNRPATQSVAVRSRTAKGADSGSPG